MKATLWSVALAAALSAGTAVAASVDVGGAAMFPEKNIVQNAVNSKDHTTLVAAVKAAGLVSTLEGKGPFTVFAPTNMAFDALPEGTVQNLLKPENKQQLVKVLGRRCQADGRQQLRLVPRGRRENFRAFVGAQRGA